MFTKYACNLLTMLVCTCIAGAVLCGVEGNSTELTSKPAECVTTCEMRRSFEAEAAEERILLLQKCDWRSRQDIAKSPHLDHDVRSATPDQRDRNGFGGPLCC